MIEKDISVDDWFFPCHFYGDPVQPGCLGVDAIWVSPFFMSPQYDFGYDVSNYCDINPEYGTLSDFDNLIHQPGYAIIIEKGIISRIGKNEEISRRNGRGDGRHLRIRGIKRLSFFTK